MTVENEEVPMQIRTNTENWPVNKNSSESVRQKPTRKPRATEDEKAQVVRLWIRQTPLNAIARTTTLNLRTVKTIIKEFTLSTSGDVDLNIERKKVVEILSEIERTAWMGVSQQLQKGRAIDRLLEQVRLSAIERAKLLGSTVDGMNEAVLALNEAKMILISVVQEEASIEVSARIAEKLKVKLLEVNRNNGKQ